jgi:hypothetical protein
MPTHFVRSSSRLGGTIAFTLLSVLLVACGLPFGGSGQAKPTATARTATTTAGLTVVPSASVVVLGPQNCPTAVQSPSYWATYVHAQPGVTTVSRVECANLMGVPSLQALVTVTHQGGHTLDVHVFTNITAPSPQQIFQLLDLYNGDAHISGYNTVITAEVDQNSTLNKGRAPADFQRDLFREFKWSDAQQTLVQVAFPAFFPDLTRYQAEADQQQVNEGHDPWKLNAVMVAQALAASTSFFDWGPAAPATLISGGGDHDLTAVVEVKSPHRSGGSIRVSMTRLESNTNGGIWEVTDVSSSTLSISAPQALARLSSPVTVSGKGEAFEGVVGTLKLLDHLYGEAGSVQVRGASGNGATTFSARLSYTNEFQGGAQEGLLMLYSRSQADGSIATGTLEKVLIG